MFRLHANNLSVPNLCLNAFVFPDLFCIICVWILFFFLAAMGQMFSMERMDMSANVFPMSFHHLDKIHLLGHLSNSFKWTELLLVLHSDMI